MLQCGTNDDKQLKIELLSQWKLEAEFRKKTKRQKDKKTKRQKRQKRQEELLLKIACKMCNSPKQPFLSLLPDGQLHYREQHWGHNYVFFLFGQARG